MEFYQIQSLTEVLEGLKEALRGYKNLKKFKLEIMDDVATITFEEEVEIALLGNDLFEQYLENANVLSINIASF